MIRQKYRKLLLLLALLLFPLCIFYLSPVLPIEAALEGIINGSLIVFCAMFFGSIFFGRVFCSYACPGGGLQECAFAANDKKPKQGRKNSIKYWVWGVWLAVVVICYVRSGQGLTIDFFWAEAQSGIARILPGAPAVINTIFNYALFYTVVFLILGSSLLGGKRTFCHYFCWMAPFMALGIKLRRLLGLPGLYISTKDSACISCKKCDAVCPMSIEVERVVKNSGDGGAISSLECIQCGACVDICPKKALKYRFDRTNE